MSIGTIYKTISLPTAEQQNDGLEGVPLSMLPSRISRCLPSTKKLVQIQFQSGNSAGPGQTSIVSLPFSTNSGYMIAGSAYLYFKLQVVGVAGVGQTWGFAGSAPSASALVNRMTISAGSVIESIQNYSLLACNVIGPFSNSNSMNLDSVAAGAFGENNYQSIPYNTSLTTSALVNATSSQYLASATDFYKYTIPIISGYLAGGCEQSVCALELMNSPLQIQADWSTITQAFFCNNVAPTNYIVSELSIVYESVSLGSQYTQGLRTAMAGGKLYSTPFSSVISVQTAYTSSLSYNMSLNTSSLDAVFYGIIINGNTQNSALTSKVFSASVGSSATLDASNIQRRATTDGENIYSLSLYNCDALLVRELVRALTGVINPDTIKMPFNVAGNVNLSGNFRGSNYVVAYNCRSFADQSICMAGRPCSVLNIQQSETATLNAGDNMTIFACVSMIAVLDGSGAISLIR
jgi:hypothetical protein